MANTSNSTTVVAPAYASLRKSCTGSVLLDLAEHADHGTIHHSLQTQVFRHSLAQLRPHAHQHIGDVVTFREVSRWTDSAVVTPSVIAQTLGKGSMGCVYKLPDICMQEVEVLGRALQDADVKLERCLAWQAR